MSVRQHHRVTNINWHTLDIYLNPVFLARNRMVTSVVAKQAKTTKVKNKFVNGKKRSNSKEYLVVFLVEGEKFNLGEKN